eukprot:TRINITY_DN4031_c0_g1_i1.p1 TRINITY_DN4031_c0_g1~~TRINITY_DN4031_c0_g1_i1.p1  ORF type:complete len:362 (+),score=22.13 TRINITY_DN4031_c0_g1_i1:324-1409(+)
MPAPKPVFSQLYQDNYTMWEKETFSTTEDGILVGLEAYLDSLVNATKLWLHTINNYVDIDYMLWVRWLLSPVFLCFVILPSLILVFIYISSIILYIHRIHRLRLLNTLQNSVEQGDLWTAGREIVATLWDAHAWLWHGYELKGLENLPTDTGCLLVYYHGAIPLDYYYLVNRVLLLKGVMIKSVVDRCLFSMPGVKIILDVFGCTSGTVDSLAEELSNGQILGLSPGGIYEAQFSDHYYKVEWRNRLGFARAALKANVPILPVFTVNIREAFRTLPLLGSFWHFIYMKTRLPVRPLFGGFPVKLTTYVGAPIYPKEDMTPELLRDQVKASIESMISQHQRVPGKILPSIIDRVWKSRDHSD